MLMSNLASLASTPYSPDGLVLDRRVISEPVILLAGQSLARGAVLGRITDTDTFTLSSAAAVDGSQVPECVLAEDTDATAGDRSTLAYFNGKVNQKALILGEGHTIAAIYEGLRVKRIQLVDLG